MGLGRRLGAARRATETATVRDKANEEPCTVQYSGLRAFGLLIESLRRESLHATGG